MHQHPPPCLGGCSLTRTTFPEVILALSTWLGFICEGENPRWNCLKQKWKFTYWLIDSCGQEVPGSSRSGPLIKGC